LITLFQRIIDLPLYSPNNIQEYLRQYISKYEIAGYGHEVWMLLTFFIFVAWFYFLWTLSETNKTKIKSLLFFVTTLLLWISFQVPNLAQYSVHINECQHIAEGNRIVDYPVFWKQLDGTTLGPLPIYYLGVFKLLGVPLDYFTIKLLNFSIWLFVIFTVYKIFRLNFGREDSVVFLSPIVTIIIFFSNHDYLGYNGEPLTVLLLTVAVLLISKLLFQSALRVSYYEFLLGFVLVAVPFSKFQGGPIAFAIGVYYLILLIIEKKSLLPILLGVFSFLIIIFALIFMSDSFYDFWQSFIINNISYASTSEGLNSQKGIFVRVLKLVLTIFGAVETRVLFLMALGLLVIKIRKIIPGVRKLGKEKINLRDEKLFYLYFFLLAIFTVYVPGNVFYHYALFLIVPSLLFIIYSIDDLFSIEQFLKKKLILIVFVLIPGTLATFSGNEIFSQLAAGQAQDDNAVVQYLRTHSQSNDKLALWGWESCIYANTGLIMATRESQTQRQMLSPKQQDYYIKRYLVDISEERPRYFLDSTKKNSWILDFDKHNYQNYPELKKFIDQNYCLILDTEGMLLFELCEPKT